MQKVGTYPLHIAHSHHSQNSLSMVNTYNTIKLENATYLKKQNELIDHIYSKIVNESAFLNYLCDGSES